ncbi:type II toxin-antitoxin system HicA family toxin [Candidatus Micrarchaeota archaeon]|nr:type II toxin-antitoxin system HicA family toxin [Candidatus Micrarchaeota archaeon]
MTTFEVAMNVKTTTRSARAAGCVVQLHKELKIGTLKGILKQARLKEDDFMKMI